MIKEKNYNETKEVASGIVESIIRIIKKTIIFGMVIPFIIYIFIRFLEIAFGYSWQQQLIFQYIAYIYVIGYVAFLVYMSVKSQIHSTLYYSIGWILGLLLLYRLNIFEFEMFKDFIIIPAIFIILKILYLILKKSKTN
jgi:hypothetical protein